MIKLSDQHILLTGLATIDTHRGEPIPVTALECRVAALEPPAQHAIAHLVVGDTFHADIDLRYGVLNGIPVGIRCIDILVSE